MWELLYKKGLVWKGKSDNSVRKVCAPGQSLSFCSSAWNDGRIRAFVPATGEPMYEINNAHNLGVTAIAATSDCKQIISGGGDGQVRIWNIGEKTQKLREVLKEHRGAVSCIKTNKNDKEGVTASLDGTCVIWDLERYVRKQMILDNTLFKCVCYHRGEYQIITSGTDRKIVYWEVLDGSAIREVQGSLSSSINGMDITSDGASFVTGECVVGAGERRSS
ncbi:cilia- and flagella-associated protein 52-like [Columba livia]|uniref:cilia- and flagella-associated protein 52-like n=1 Tax=Columba livia TaxID=8932 RepID=UPI0031BA0A3F